MKTLIAIAFLFFSYFSSAQAPTLVVEGNAPNLYIAHIVIPKESYYSVARLYNLGPAVIAGFNGSNLQTGLKIGQSLKIPLTTQNFDQKGQKEGGETLVPVYHVVTKSETLFRIGNNYNKVAPAAIKDWNNLSGDNLVVGTPLIVGYLKIKNDQLAALNAATPAPLHHAAATSEIAVAEPAANTTKESNAFNPAATNNTDKKPDAQPATPIISEKALEVKPAAEVEKKPDTPVNVADIVEKKAEPPIEKKAVETKPDLLTPTTSSVPEEGFFGASYLSDMADKKLAENTGDAGTFKSTSGWQNKKYYVLMNNVEPGTIIKISASDKTIYAKVLGSLPEMKENNNLLLRISNAAASYLGKVDPKFPVQVSYYQ